LKPWEALFLLESSASLKIRFNVFGHEHIINLKQLGAADLEAYASLGGKTIFYTV